MFIIIGDVFQFIVHCLKKIAEYFGHFYLIFNIFVVKTNCTFVPTEIFELWSCNFFIWKLILLFLGEIDTEEDNIKGKTSPISSSGELGGPKSVEADKTEPEKSDEEKSAKIEDEDKKSSKSEKESSPENSPKQDEDPSGN